MIDEMGVRVMKVCNKWIFLVIWVTWENTELWQGLTFLAYPLCVDVRAYGGLLRNSAKKDSCSSGRVKSYT
jgi:hypothetical protein